MTATALFSLEHFGANRGEEELILLDLDTLTAGRLVEETNPLDSSTSIKLNLT